MRGIGRGGWPHPFRPKPWEEIAAWLGEIADADPHFAHMAAIARSVIDVGATSTLAAFTSMHDIIVAPTPVPDPPYDVVAVRAPGSLFPPRDGMVLIEHISGTGRDDRIERPVADAVPLFWRFMIEKFGVYPRDRPDG